jgi:anaerobic ribonucleoside-triphosphate reductase activating protein
MNITATQYNLHNKAFEIYISGCKGNCKNCHNPELKNYDIGEEVDFNYIQIKLLPKIIEFEDLIDSIWILGGEPLDQNLYELDFLLSHIKIKPLWLFTRHEIDNIPNSIKQYFTYIKTGSYIEELKTDKNIVCSINLATSNQQLYKKEGGKFIAQSIDNK